MSGPLPGLLAEQGATPDWATLEVTGPTRTADGTGRAWFEYRATVSGR